MERKCTSCGTWNQNNDFCSQCAQAISPRELQKAEATQLKIAKQNAPKSKLDEFVRKIKHSKNPLVRLSFKVLSFIWFVYMAILSFFLWFIAIGPG